MIELAYADNGTAAAGGGLMGMIPFVLMLLVMWFLMIRPQQQAEKKRRQMVAELKKGDRVLLASGFYGRVVQAGEHIVKVDLGKGLVVEVAANAVSAKIDENHNETTKTDDAA
ncbi:preprotein translocase subunit YajC [Simonsiella muelleri]|uniref:Sec translocon accessory complex subunit YajC n=1 Tax=Simonsiella muelleri ATCC 29453 TaxID=641147 RepID=V9HLJ3_9NEIS|nr:preprotein translocase subunit YajC [Simonsiella muelleri]AUX61384.1 preprotein translocase subunit YajC [Simonsiella muelleri ATCC 29453]EFG31101.1 preprotein translocase, YajC subunit [Simonsiella muelleri ATCC 29453]UBQ53435.1 preprotein translocase subunit YajC [Simonsiella muelleri]